MYQYIPQTENKSSRNVENRVPVENRLSGTYPDNRSVLASQQVIQQLADNSPKVSQLRDYQQLAAANSGQERTTQLRSIASDQPSPKGSQKDPGTGLPGNLKAGIEQLSGYAMDDVKVHYNSDKPAQLQAHAYAQGTDIHVASGQEKHLPHEAWHVVQQKQGRVQATRQLKGMAAVNDDAALEAEADKMGMLALQTSSTNQPRLQSGIHSTNSVTQLARYRIGDVDDGMINSANIINEYTTHNITNTVNFPQRGEAYQFSNDYNGSVLRALAWAQVAVEGSAGWAGRDYYPEEFHQLASKASAATGRLVNPALDNEDNKTLIAIRTFRSGNSTDMAEITYQDLSIVFLFAEAAREELAASGLINNANDAVTEVKTDPAEAHPNTLPTARITYQGGRRVYFKGRAGKVEDSLVGTGQSSARAISGINPVQGSGTGMHGFVSDDTVHFSEDVGAPVQHNNATRNEVINAWVSGARTALLVMLTGTGDLHESNIIEGMDGLKHIIDAEFLLELTNWDRYVDALTNNGMFPQFEVTSGVPDWALEYTRGLSNQQRQSLANDIVLRFQALNLNDGDVQEQVLAPIRQLIQTQLTLLRISPSELNTVTWLRTLTDFHNEDNINGKPGIVDRAWITISMVFADFSITVTNNPVEAKRELNSNFEHGQVPLLHINAGTGEVYLNKTVIIGQMAQERSTENFLKLTKLLISSRYDEVLTTIENSVKTTT